MSGVMSDVEAQRLIWAIEGWLETRTVRLCACELVKTRRAYELSLEHKELKRDYNKLRAGSILICDSLDVRELLGCLLFLHAVPCMSFAKLALQARRTGKLLVPLQDVEETFNCKWNLNEVLKRLSPQDKMAYKSFLCDVEVWNARARLFNFEVQVASR